MKYVDIFNLTNKNAIITGGANGIGREMCKALAHAGANIIILDINNIAANETIEQLPAPGNHLFIETDITNEEQIITAIAKIEQLYHTIDILMNNAGICQRVSTEDMTKDEWEKTFDVNVTSMFLMSKHVLKVMKKQGGGSIINTASMAGIVSLTYAQSAYNASKGAVISLTKSLAQEWAHHNIRVNAIAPGFIQSSMTQPMFENGGPLSYVLDLVPMRRLGKAEELNGIVILLASGASSFITGAVIPVDGGYTMV
jgi:NAD(P)-dependent dehydrogenase (short-subunit alcohol dehydrogenase family)